MIDAQTVLSLAGALAGASALAYQARKSSATSVRTSDADRDAETQARLDAENARQFTALHGWNDDLQSRLDALEVRFDSQAVKLRESEDRVYSLEREVHDGQGREREMATTIRLLEHRLQQVQNRQT